MRPAESLQEAVNALQLEPLDADDRFYADLSSARESKDLAELENRLREAAEHGHGKCHLGLRGHRGSGKSTELLRMEERLSDVFFPVHLFLDQTLHLDADYPDLFLWLVELLGRRLVEEKIPIDKDRLENVALWFAEVTKTHGTESEAKIELAAESEVSARYGIFGTGLKLLARIKSTFIGSTTRRLEMRQQLQNYAQELLTNVNGFLDHAADALQKAGKPGRLLIVQDNLDRLDRKAAIKLFKDGAQIITDLHGTFVWTPPVGSHMPLFNIDNVFTVFDLPTIGVRTRQGAEQERALAGLTQLVANRLRLELTFASPDLVRNLILASGGSVRDLLRLLEYARSNARVEGHTVIEADDITTAVKKMGLGLEKILIPSSVYFPILAEIAVTKRWNGYEAGGLTPDEADKRRAFFHQLILEGAVFAYNGDGLWYDVHPSLHRVALFREACDAFHLTEKKPRKPSAKAAKARGKTTRKK